MAEALDGVHRIVVRVEEDLPSSSNTHQPRRYEARSAPNASLADDRIRPPGSARGHERFGDDASPRAEIRSPRRDSTPRFVSTPPGKAGDDPLAQPYQRSDRHGTRGCKARISARTE